MEKILWNFKHIVLFYIHNNNVNNLTWGWGGGVSVLLSTSTLRLDGFLKTSFSTFI